MDPLHEKLKALKPDEPDEEIAKDLAELRRARPGIQDEEILGMAQQLVAGGGKMPPMGVQPRPADPGAPGAPSGVVPAGAAEPPPTPAPSPAPLAAPAPLPTDDDLAPHGIKGDDVAMAALQGLAGLGDAIGNAYGGQKTDFLKSAMGAEGNEMAKRKLVAENLRAQRGEAREDRKLGIESAKAQLEAMKKAGKDTFEMEEKLRDGFGAQAKTFTTVRDQYGVLKAAASEPSAAGDLALIFAFMKLTDPSSSVKETEFANAENAAGVPDRVRNTWNKVLAGERFAPETRADFVNQADKLFNAHKQTFQANKTQYDALADAYGLDKGRVTSIVVGEAPEAPPSGPQKVKVSNGSETLLIDPADLAEAEKDGFKKVP